jgi:hypothetical protein
MEDLAEAIQQLLDIYGVALTISSLDRDLPEWCSYMELLVTRDGKHTAEFRAVETAIATVSSILDRLESANQGSADPQTLRSLALVSRVRRELHEAALARVVVRNQRNPAEQVSNCSREHPGRLRELLDLVKSDTGLSLRASGASDTAIGDTQGSPHATENTGAPQVPRSHPLEKQGIIDPKGRDQASKALRALFAAPRWLLTGADLQGLGISTCRDAASAAQSVYQSITQRYQAVAPYLHFRRSDPPAVFLTGKPKR